MQKFKSNELNVLVATCIAEEGLDIGEVFQYQYKLGGFDIML